MGITPARVRAHLGYRWRQAVRAVRGAPGRKLPRLPPMPYPGPPEVPEGWHCAPPDFVGVGTQKAGTTWWHSCIAAHPGVHAVPGAAKEIHYFDQFWEKPFDDAAAAAYARHFPRGAGGIAGEWTPRYMFAHWIPPMLRAAAPEARILVMLRDPVERYRSGLVEEIYGHSSVAMYDHPNAATSAAARGLYHLQLSGILRHYPRERVLVLQYERATAAPVVELGRTWEFLGLENDPVLAAAVTPRKLHVTERPKAFMSPSERRELLGYYEADLALLLRDFGDSIDRSLWPTCAALGMR